MPSNVLQQDEPAPDGLRKEEPEGLLRTGANTKLNGRTACYTLPGDSIEYECKISSATLTFSDLEKMLQQRRAPPGSFIAVQNPGTKRWLQKADFEGGVLPDWQHFKIKVINDPPPPPPPPEDVKPLRRIPGPWGPIW
eukprot:CAMPEP_0202919724 /NCGR_PEP_ID=MMETSP1392-20130828/76483_1 /ASSEMBLY_ACC=CAM_ASM_000868 /TAXON_ID=225041 /ORGANISM="Chlamydomonas chlamydogama, Strain SAG 11-48b" /LENGTH=137 /DNA_ID=CAMNT_0049613183 /DNA_START=84 /DNA_END=494 /DNA_ORIENTATION=-